MTSLRRLRLIALLAVTTVFACSDPAQTITVASVELQPDQLTLLTGEQRSILAIVFGTNNNQLTDREVTWSTSNASIASVDNTGLVRAMSAGSAQITATSEGKSGTAQIQINNPAPVAAAISPNSALAGGAAFTLTVTGSGFVTGAQVRWNGATKTTTRVSSTELSANITAADIVNVAIAQVTVTNPAPGGGTSQQLQFSITAAPVNNPDPTLATIVPANGVAGGPAFTLTLTGTNFIPASSVRWAGVARTTTYVSATQLTAQITAADIANTGAVAVTVFNPAPGGGTSNQRQFNVNAPSNPDPTVASIVPNSANAGGQSFTLTVNGTGYVAASQVRWNGNTRATTFISATQLTAQITAADIASAGSALVSVFNPAPGGGTSGNRVFTIVEDPDPTLISAADHVCGIKSSGAAYCWGPNESGQLGNGTNVSSTVPVAVSGAIVFRRITSGYQFSCGLTAAGVAYCWGEGGYGQIGDGSGIDRNIPTPVSGGLTFKSISAGNSFACGLTTAGAAYCWGSELFGQLGNGSSSQFRFAPVPVSGGRVFTFLHAGGGGACGIEAAGTAYCWGENNFGSVGDGTTTDRNVPTLVAGGNSFKQISVGGGVTCGTTTTGAGMCWGNGNLGQIGNGSDADVKVPAPVAGGHTFASVTAGPGYSCGITIDAKLYCWGFNVYGVFGTGNANGSNVPVAAATGLNIQSISLGGVSCAITVTEVPYCWGTKEFGLLGDGQVPFEPAPVAVTGGLRFSQIVAGGRQTCAIQVGTGNVYCWGARRWELSRQQDDIATPQLQQMPAGVALVSLVGGDSHMCGLTNIGDAYCWGVSVLGELGNNLLGEFITPVAVSGGIKFTALAAGKYNTCGLGPGAAPHCWGGYFGGPPAGQRVPALLTGAGSFASIAAGYYHMCGLRANGAAACWWDNFYSQFGNGDDASSTGPQLMSGGFTYSQITAGETFTCAIRTSDKRALCAGTGAAAGLLPFRQTPGTISGGHAFDKIAAGRFHVCGIVVSTVYCWGNNSQGELGRGTTGNPTTVPAAITGAFVQITSRNSHTCALEVDGDAFCWGRQDNGAIGNGKLGYVSTPKLVVW